MSSSRSQPVLAEDRHTNAEPSASFTPGPWRVETDGLPEMRNVSTYVVAGDRLDGALICDVNTSPADARLIAAAPDLYAHLRFAVTLLSALPAMSGTAQVEAMRKALAKAGTTG